VATPFVVEKGAELSADEVKKLLHQEINNLEGFAIDDAIFIAELTRKIVQYIVVPVSQLFATIGAGALGILIGALQSIEGVLGFVHVPTSLIAGLIGVMQQWQSNVDLFPQALRVTSNGDLKAAEAYLKALKNKMS
jgi:hypothetical protein